MAPRFYPDREPDGGAHTVSRNIGGASLPNAAEVAGVMGNDTFNTFRPTLEGIHNSGHVWVSGTMSIVNTAPADPTSWMHHAEIDRIWAEWQAHLGRGPAYIALPLRSVKGDRVWAYAVGLSGLPRCVEPATVESSRSSTPRS